MLAFLGLEIDTLNMQIRIPDDEVAEICNILKRHIQKLTSLKCTVRKLSFFSKTVSGSRAFNRPFYNVMLGNYQPYHHINITTKGSRRV